jgi:acyl-coenzyme A thioesterase PaaI-like protein
VGRTIGTAQAKVVDEAGKLYAHGTATCVIFRNEGENGK